MPEPGSMSERMERMTDYAPDKGGGGGGTAFESSFLFSRRDNYDLFKKSPYFNTEYGRQLTKTHLDADLGFTPEELSQLGKTLNEMADRENIPEDIRLNIKDRIKRERKRLLDEQQRQGSRLTPDQITQAVQKGFSASRQETKLPRSNEYRSFLEAERWGAKDLDIDDLNPPQFYLDERFKGRAEQERRDFLQLRCMWARGHGYKRAKGWSLSSMVKSEEEGFRNEMLNQKKTQLRFLYEEVPGGHEALKIYAQYAKDPTKTFEKVVVDRRGRRQIKEVAFKDTKDRDGAEATREYVAEQIRLGMMRKKGEYARKGYPVTDADIKQMAIDAEQAAWNYFYFFNTWEDAGIRWELRGDRMVRVRADAVKNFDISHVPLAAQMQPLGGLVGQVLSSRKDRMPVGSFTEWAAYQTQMSAKGHGLNPENVKITEIITVPDNSKQDADKFWTLSNIHRGTGGEFTATINVPECYPIFLVHGMLFINGVKDSEGNLTESFIDIFARGGKIDDWSKVSGGSEDLGAGYGLQFSGAATIWEAYQLGSEKTSMSEDVMKALAGKKQGHNWKAKRWMDYARRGVYTEYRNPKLIMSRDAKKSLIRVYRLKNLSPERAMFDWDRPLL